jgi:hypothetical protein
MVGIVVGLGVGCKKAARRPRPFDGRRAGLACPATRPPGDARDRQSGDGATCAKDDDCTAGRNGRCMGVGTRVRSETCTYDACLVDADCKTGGPCECSALGNTCLAGNCRTDADCGDDGSCGQARDAGCGAQTSSYYCRTPDDTCLEDSDCGANARCTYSPELAHWGCITPPICPVG